AKSACTYGPRPPSSPAACAAEEKRREEKRREEKRREEKRREEKRREEKRREEKRREEKREEKVFCGLDSFSAPYIGLTG
ncbi:hypothetical protein KMJ45_002049, partial [Neisseria gonorrhoeae]